MQTNKIKFTILKSVLGFFIIGGILFFYGCKKKSDSSPAPATDPVVTSFTQKVVVEKYTGEWCGSCPAAGTFFDQMKTKYGNKFIGVAVHAATPDRYESNQACKDMYSYLTSQLKDPGFSGTIGFPNVMFMRSLNPLNSAIINGYSNIDWPLQVSSELAKKASCGLSLVTKLNGKLLSTTVKFQVSKNIPAGGLYAITAYVVENELDGSMQVSASSGYKQQHVLRELLTPKEGTYIDITTIDKPIELKLADVDISAYNAANLEVIAFIHKKGSVYSDRKILNGQIVKAGSSQAFD